MWAALSALFVVFLFVVVGTVVFLAAKVVGFLQPILIPVAIAVILAYLLDPLVTQLTRRGLGRTASIAILFAFVFLAIGGLLAWLVPMISLQSANAAKELPEYTRKARDFTVDLIYRYDRTFGVPELGKSKGSATKSFIDWLLAPTVNASPTPTPAPSASPATVTTPAGQEEIKASPPANADQKKLTVAERKRIQLWVEKQLPNLQHQIPNLADKFWEVVKTSIGGFLGVTGFLLSLIMVPIYLFFLLKERPAIARRWKEYLPLRASPLKEEVATVILQINSYVIAYFRGQLLVCMVDGLLIGVSLFIYGLPFAPLIGLLVSVLTMIPYIGIVLCWIPAVLIAAVTWGSWSSIFWVTVIFLVVQNAEAILYAPRIVGNSVGLHPMTVIVSIFVWGLLIGGLLGPILAIPLTATLKVLLARYVWGRRLRREVMENIEDAPVVREEERARAK